MPNTKKINLNVLSDNKNFFDQSITDNSKAYEKIRKISTGHSDDSTTG